LPLYNHDNLSECFAVVFAALERAFTAYIPEPVERLPVEGPFEDGIYVSEITKRELLNQALFVLVAQADVPMNRLSELPAGLKVATVDTIRECVVRKVGSIEFQQLPSVPRQLPAKHPAIYLALDAKSEGWRDLSDSDAFAFHIQGKFPKLNLEFWAIRTMRH
jgi:type VI secretion system protein ImpJ